MKNKQSEFIVIHPDENCGCKEILKFVVGLECVVYYDTNTSRPTWYQQKGGPVFRPRIIAINVDRETKSMLTLRGLNYGDSLYSIHDTVKEILRDKWKSRQ